MKRQQVIRDIKRAISAAEMGRASFASAFGLERDEATEQIKEITRLYRETWILEPLRAVLRELEGKK